MDWIHYNDGATYNDIAECGSDEWYSFDKLEVTCPKCLSSMWIMGNSDHNIYVRYKEAMDHIKIPYGTMAHDVYEIMSTWNFLSLPENEDLYLLFLQECIIDKTFFK